MAAGMQSRNAGGCSVAGGGDGRGCSQNRSLRRSRTIFSRMFDVIEIHTARTLRAFFIDRKDSFHMSQSVYDRNEVVRTLNMFVGKGGIAEIRIMNAFGVKGRK
jgi:hypothetical protein